MLRNSRIYLDFFILQRFMDFHYGTLNDNSDFIFGFLNMIRLTRKEERKTKGAKGKEEKRKPSPFLNLHPLYEHEGHS